MIVLSISPDRAHKPTFLVGALWFGVIVFDKDNFSPKSSDCDGRLTTQQAIYASNGMHIKMHIHQCLIQIMNPQVEVRVLLAHIKHGLSVTVYLSEC